MAETYKNDCVFLHVTTGFGSQIYILYTHALFLKLLFVPDCLLKYQRLVFHRNLKLVTWIMFYNISDTFFPFIHIVDQCSSRYRTKLSILRIAQ